MKAIRELRYGNELGFRAALLLKWVKDLLFYRLMPDAFYIKKQFRKTFGYPLDLSNPQTLNEKMQWLKLHDRNDLNTLCADKYRVRDYVAGKIGEEYLIPLLFHTINYLEIKPENIPDAPFIIKATHTAGTNHIIKDKTKADWKKIQNDCRWWMHQNYHYPEKEWQYKNIRPRIVVEKLLTDKNGQVPSDFKLHYFNGKFEFLQVDIDRFSDHRRNLYDANWNLLPFTWSIHRDGKPVWSNGREISRPAQLEKMIELGEKLAAPFRYVRIDFYQMDNRIYFGEITFHHGGGFEYFEPKEWDFKWGSKITLQ